ncbi:MAG: Gfo/Idh/MocA family oxidoreductase [Spirochaetes bacterium]|nr:Gfo/Idh/MocA family oxidoreductase [Spirochaetota bacterium]
MTPAASAQTPEQSPEQPKGIRSNPEESGGSQENSSPANKIKCAFIGIGRIASILEDDPLREKPCTHAGAVKENPDTVISAGCDIKPERRELFSKKWNCPVFEDPAEMLKKINPDIVFIATWPDSHLEMVQKAITQGVKVIVCEKPLADKLGKAKKIALYHKKGAAKIITNHERRYSNDYVLAKKRIDEKTYGELLSISAFLYMGKTKRIIDVMWHDGTHLADIIMYFTGSVLKKWKIAGNIKKGKGTAFITAYTKSKKAGKTPEDNLRPQQLARREIPVIIQCGAEREHLTFSLELSFESGLIKIGNGIYEEWKSEKSPFYTGFNSLVLTETPQFEKTGYFENMVKDAVKAFKEPDYTPVSTAVHGYNAVKFLSSLK